MKNSIYLLWSSGNMLLDTLEILKAWGFKYKSVLLIWAKATNDY